MFKILVIVVTFFLLCQAKVFRFDYEYNDDADGWLKFHIVPGTWSEARMRCNAEGAVLASPLNEQLKKAILAFVQRKTRSTPTTIFIGVHASFSKGDYTSIEGKPLTRLSITWAPGEPNNYKNAESCLAMFADDNGITSDVRCDDVLPYVCYKKFAHLTMTECGTTDAAYQLEPRTGSCYKFHHRGLVWSQAFMTCLAEGGHLAIINNEVEQEVVRDIFMKNPDNTIRSTETDLLGIGFHDWGEHMTFLTIHGETLDEAGFQKWAEEQPNNVPGHGYGQLRPGQHTNDEGQSCGTVYRDALLNDMWCNVPAAFLCEKNPRSLIENKF